MHKDKLLHEEITSILRKSKQNMAAYDEMGQVLSHGELDQRSNQLAHFLRKQGVSRQQLIGIFCDRRVDLLIMMLGILKAGAGYVPLDSEHPKGRLKEMVDKSRLDTIIASESQLEKLQELVEICPTLTHIYVIDDKGASTTEAGITPIKLRLQEMPMDEVESINHPSDLACVLFTSGSTGKPKGVMVHHQGILNCLEYALREFDFSEQDRFVAVSSMGFDMSLFEFFAPLLAGASVHLAKKDTVRDPWKMIRFLKEHKITVWHSVPTLWGLWLNELKAGDLPEMQNLRYVFLGGERLMKDYVRTSHTLLPQTTVINIYGPTETTIWMSAHRVEQVPGGEERIPAGKPIDQVEVLVLDDQLDPLPRGEVGEICIRGVCVSHGYLNDPELTEKSFLHYPTDSDDFLYRTGDLGRLLPDGNLDIVGRKDFQVKIRGNRVELGEIESLALDLPNVIQTAVVVDEKEGDQIIHCFLVGEKDHIDEQEVRDHLKEHLAPYMIPHQFHKVASLPLNSNGKVDRKAVREVWRQWITTVRPSLNTGTGDAQQHVRKAWKLVLGHEDFSDEDSFFDVGGDSIKAVQLKNELDERFAGLVEVVDIFTYPTVNALTDHLQKAFTPKEREVWIKEESAATREVTEQSVADHDIAVIGLEGYFPGEKSLEGYWKTLSGGESVIREVPKERWDPATYYSEKPMNPEKTSSKWGGFIDDIGDFDADFFNISAKEATLMDPQQRLMLETVVSALERAGYGGEKLNNTETGVFISGSNNDYFMGLLENKRYNETFFVIGNQPSMLPNRISYMLNLNGPSLFVDTACSSSLVAIHQACRSLRDGECQMAIAGGVSLNLSPERYISLSKMTVLSPTGSCKAFDREADGLVPGEGVGAVVLKPLKKALADGDRIHGVIKGSAVNHGGKAIGITAPNPGAQEAVIQKAFLDAGVSPETVSFVEAHGTGTPLGDPIEFKALRQTFSEQPRSSVTIGSVKTVIGHLGEAAGIASLIKVLLALQNRRIPPTVNFQSPNPELDMEESPFTINTVPVEWKPRQGIRRAGISSFGMGGTNAHLVVEEAPEVNRRGEWKLPEYLIPVSAKNKESFMQKVKDLHRFVEENREIHLGDLSYTLGTGRGHYAYRLALVVRDREELLKQLNRFSGSDVDEGFPSLKGIYFQRNDARETPVLVSYATDQWADLKQEALLLHEYFPAFRLWVKSLTQSWPKEDQEKLWEDSAGLIYVLTKWWQKIVRKTKWEYGSGYSEKLIQSLQQMEGLRFLLQQTKEARSLLEIQSDAGDGFALKIGSGADEKSLFHQLALCYTHGVHLDWEELYAGFKTMKLELPIYPFNKKRYWFNQSEPVMESAGPTEKTRDNDHSVNKEMDLTTTSLTKEELARSLESVLKNILKEEPEDITVDTDLYDLNLDSLAMVELVNAIGELTDVQLDPTELYDFTTLNEIADYLTTED